MIRKVFRITERVGFEFRAEVFNVTNTPPLNDPNGSFGSAAFATITSAGNPRDFEFAGKVRFYPPCRTTRRLAGGTACPTEQISRLQSGGTGAFACRTSLSVSRYCKEITTPD